MQAVVSDAVIISYRPHQTKVGVLPVDCIRMSQALEWQPAGGVSASEAVLAAAPPAAPNKVTLFRCTATHVAAALASTVDALPSGKVMLCYVSGDQALGAQQAVSQADVAKGSGAGADARANAQQGAQSVASAGHLQQLAHEGVLLFPSPKHMPAAAGTHATGVSQLHSALNGTAAAAADASQGLEQIPDALRDLSLSTEPAHDKPTATRPAPEENNSQSATTDEMKAVAPRTVVSSQQLLLPQDLVGLTRKRLLLVVDSDNAQAFAQVAARPLTHAPLLLLSPQRIRRCRASSDQVLLHCIIRDRVATLAYAHHPMTWLLFSAACRAVSTSLRS